MEKSKGMGTDGKKRERETEWAKVGSSHTTLLSPSKEQANWTKSLVFLYLPAIPRPSTPAWATEPFVSSPLRALELERQRNTNCQMPFTQSEISNSTYKDSMSITHPPYPSALPSGPPSARAAASPRQIPS